MRSECATKMDRVLPNSIVKVFPNSSHVPFYEEPNEYFPQQIEIL